MDAKDDYANNLEIVSILAYQEKAIARQDSLLFFPMLYPPIHAFIIITLQLK
jgi:hypothetical protein